MAKSEVQYILASRCQTSNQSESSFSVAATSTPPPSPDELLFAQWLAELASIIQFEAIENPSQEFGEAWFTAICKIKAPEFKNAGIFGARAIDSDDLKSFCHRLWCKTIETIGKS